MLGRALAQALRRLWFVYLRESARGLKSAILRGEGRLSEGRFVHRFGWEEFLADRVLDSRAYYIEYSDAVFNSFQNIHAFNARHLYRIRRAVAWPGGTLVLNGHPIQEAGTSSPVKRLSSFSSLDFALRLEPKGIFLGTAKPNYYHWLIEDLPTLLRATMAFPDVPVFLGGQEKKYMRELLELAGIKYSSTRVPTRFSELFLAGRGEDSGWPHRDDLRLLRGTFVKPDSSPVESGGRRVFIDRKNSRRATRNAADLEKIAGEFGFETYSLEEMKVEDQISLFEGASAVLGTHGAGFANLVFCRAGTKVLEITPAHHAVNCYRVLSQQLCLDHKTLIVAKGKRSRESTLDADELGSIRESIRTLLSKSAF